MPEVNRRTLARVGLVALHWVLLTVALGALVTYSADSLRAFIEPNLDGSLLFVGAFIAAFILGTTIDSLKVLIPLAVTAAMIFAMVLFAPTFADVTVRTNSLENYAATRVFLFSVLMFLPAVVGAGAGNLASGYIRDDVLGPDDELGVDETSWYARRSGTGERDLSV